MKANKIVVENDYNITKSFYLIDKLQVLLILFDFDLVWKETKNRKRMQFDFYKNK